MADDPTPGQVTAYLEDVQRRWEVFGESDAMPRLLAAAGAGQKLIADWQETAGKLDGRADRADAAGQTAPSILLSARAQAYGDCARELREAISRALLEEDD